MARAPRPPPEWPARKQPPSRRSSYLSSLAGLLVAASLGRYCQIPHENASALKPIVHGCAIIAVQGSAMSPDGNHRTKIVGSRKRYEAGQTLAPISRPYRVIPRRTKRDEHGSE